MSKLTHTEKLLLESFSGPDYTFFRCPEHGLQAVETNKGSRPHRCFQCKKELQVFDQNNTSKEAGQDV